MKKLYYLILPVITLLFGFIFTSNTYAVDDISVTVSGQVNQSRDVFSNCTGDCLNDYQYLIVESNSDVGYSSFYFWIRFDGSYTRNFYVSTFQNGNTYNIYKLPFNGTSNNFLEWGQNLYFDSDLKLTLTESLPSNTPDCPEPPAPEPCDCDDAFIVGLFKDSFWRVATAIVALIVPILALFLLFRLVHGLMFGKGI